MNEPNDRAAWLAGVAALLQQAQPTRYIKRGGEMICLTCNLALPYCKGHAPDPPDDPPARDGDTTDLAKRIAAAREKNGGR